MEGIWSLHWHV